MFFHYTSSISRFVRNSLETLKKERRSICLNRVVNFAKLYSRNVMRTNKFYFTMYRIAFGKAFLVGWICRVNIKYYVLSDTSIIIRNLKLAASLTYILTPMVITILLINEAFSMRIIVSCFQQ